MTPNRIAAVAGGAVFGAVGAVSVVIAGSLGLWVGEGTLILGQLSTNVLLGALHLTLAGAFVAGFLRGDRVARMVNTAVGTVLLRSPSTGPTTCCTSRPRRRCSRPVWERPARRAKIRRP